METAEIRQQLDELKSEWFWTHWIRVSLQDAINLGYGDAELLRERLEEKKEYIARLDDEIARYTDLMKEATPND